MFSIGAGGLNFILLMGGDVKGHQYFKICLRRG
jgi:hypothetical protein